MANKLEQSAAATVHIGPIVDATDGVTPETGLTAAGVDAIEVWKDSGTAATDISGTTTFTHRSGGVYTVTLSTSDTGTVGHLRLVVRDADVCLPVWRDFEVVPSNVYDSLVGGTDNLEVDVVAEGGVTYLFTGQVQAVAADTPSAGITRVTISDPGLSSDADDQFVGGTFLLLDRSTQETLGRGEIGDYDGTNFYVFIDDLPVTPTTAMDYGVAMGDQQASTSGSLPEVNATQVGSQTASATGAVDFDDLASILVDTAEIGAAGAGLTAVPWNSAWDTEVQSEVNDALVALHLDHLLAADYDPASPPGVATALLNEIMESDAGVARFTVNALENAPSGSGASAETIADAVWDEAQADHVTAGSFGIIASEIASILADTNELQTDDVPGLIAALNDLSAAEVNAEVLDVLDTDTFAELGSVPAATATLADKITWLFMLARNKVTQTATTQTVRDDGDSANVATSTVSDDGTTFTRGEYS